MRTFIALELPEEFRSEVLALSRVLERSCEGRFVPPENLHLTLAFLGEIGEAESADALDALEVAAARSVAPMLVSDGLGHFGKPRNATLWLGIRMTSELEELADNVRGELKQRGLTFDAKPFRAHITLARHVCLEAQHLDNLPFPEPARAEELTLFRSILEPEGAHYKPLYTVELPLGLGIPR